ncbi:MAG: hypothetical protein FJY76_00450 [Candidatus Aenigmarchaeota archaeon]|nr:hypothetical protein [Candidatus Aenigmarchaeota archaeon]
MDKPLAVCGLLLLIGFLATHYLLFSIYDYTLVPAVWVVLAVVGIAVSKGCCCCRKKGRFGKKCSCCCSGAMAVAVAEGIILTAAILIQLVAVSPFYLVSVWMLVIGAALVADGLKGSPLRLQLGLFWLFSAVLFPFLNNYQGSSMLIGALVMGVPLILAGIVKKE